MLLRSLMFAAALIVAPLARADIIVDWSERASAAMVAEGPATTGNPIALARALAMMHVAMFDAIDACDPTFKHYLGALPAAPGASPQAAAHAAARAVLAALYPNQKATLDARYAEALAAISDSSAKENGVAIGEKAAQLMLALRKDDGTFGVPDAYRPFTAPGTYVPTGLPVVSNVALRQPFAMQGNAQFRPGPPPALDSAIWARDFNETKEWGAINSPRRSAWQTETARFWEQLGPPAWNQVARSLSAHNDAPLAVRARVFALLNMAMLDAYLAVFDTKYHYNFWRPLTAIRNGDQDGNDATVRDATWRPLIDTPPHPEYPCAHCAADGAAGAILKAAFGAGKVGPFSLTYAAMPKVTREYSSIDQLQAEVSMARIWGGVHFRNSNEVGEALGEKVGAYLLTTRLTPAAAGHVAAAAAPSGPPATSRLCDADASKEDLPGPACLLSHESIGRLAGDAVYWSLNTYPSADAAMQDRGANGSVVKAFGKTWLFTIGPLASRPSKGTQVAAVGPIPVTAAASYDAEFLKSTFSPGMTAPLHVHSGPEAFYAVSGDTCLETPDGIQLGRGPGNSMVVRAGPPMLLVAPGPEPRKGFALILHDAALAPTTLVHDWTPKRLCDAERR